MKRAHGETGAPSARPATVPVPPGRCCWAVGPPPHHARRASGCTRPRRPHAARAARSSARVVHRIALIVLLAKLRWAGERRRLPRRKLRTPNRFRRATIQAVASRCPLTLTIPQRTHCRGSTASSGRSRSRKSATDSAEGGVTQVDYNPRTTR